MALVAAVPAVRSGEDLRPGCRGPSSSAAAVFAGVTS